MHGRRHMAYGRSSCPPPWGVEARSTTMSLGRIATTPALDLRVTIPISLGSSATGRTVVVRRALRRPFRLGPLHLAAGVHHKGAVLLERYARENLGEEVGRVVLGRDVGHGDEVRAAKLPHLEELTVDVTRMLS